MRFLIYLLLGYIVYRIVRGMKAPALPKSDSATEIHRDPVCGVYISPGDAVVGTLNGKRIHFCSIGCLERFEKDQQQR